MKASRRTVLCAILSVFLSSSCPGEEGVFPHRMPEKKPDIPLSAAMERMFDYMAPRVQDNELFSQFKYTRLGGFGCRLRAGHLLGALPFHQCRHGRKKILDHGTLRL